MTATLIGPPDLAAPLTAPAIGRAGAVVAEDPRDACVRLAALFDPDSLRLLGAPDGSGVAAGVGRVEGTPAAAFATDPRQRGGALSIAGCDRIASTIHYAVSEQAPVVGLWHSGGAEPGRFHPHQAGPQQNLSAILPDSPRRACDVRRLLPGLLDGPPVELQPVYAGSIVTALGRLTGRTVGVVANNPLRLAGCLNTESAEKAARFVRMCDSLGVPLVVVIDVPGFLPSVGQEWAGVVRRGAKLLHAFAEAVVPRVTLVTRKAYGGAYIAMNSRALGATAVFAWPGAEVAVMAASAAVEILHRKVLADVPPEQHPASRALLIDQQARSAGGLDRAVRLGVVDEIITPSETRRHFAEALEQAPAQAGRHTNIPL